jgi:hypothetical protein
LFIVFTKYLNFDDPMEITKDIHIEDLVQLKPASVLYLADRGIKCIACGEPIWGTLEEAALEKGFTGEEIAAVVKELNTL